MLDYLLKSGAILAILFLFYKLVLENAQMHTFKRGFLLMSLLAAFGIPLLVFTDIIYYVPQVSETFVIGDSYSLEEPMATIDKTNYLAILLKTIYFLGVFLFGIRFLFNLLSIGKRIKQNPHHKRPPFTEVLMANLKSPYTFFNYIFLDKYKAETNVIPKEVLWHEEAHARQKHSLDVLLIEALQVVFWFNPFLHFIKKSIKLNHEFLADEAVISKGVPAQTYQQTILTFSRDQSYPQLSNALNYKPIKKRFTQMKTKTTKKAIWIKSILILPLLAVLIYSFSQKETQMVAQTVDTHVTDDQDNMNQINSEGATEIMMEEYRRFIKNSMIKGPNGHTKVVIIQDQLERAKAIYAIMNDKQRSEVKEISVKIPSIDLSKTTPRKMTAIQFEKFKDGEIYAIWIDSRHVPNSTLNNYNYKDFKHYSGSIVHKNARSKKFPQPNQYHLYTKEGFEHTYLNYKERRLKKLTSSYNKKIKDSEDESTKRIYKQLIEMLLEDLDRGDNYGIGPVKEYQDKNAIYEKNRKRSPHFKDRTKEGKQLLLNQMSELGGLFFRLSSANKKLVKRPISPIHPYVKFTVDGKEVYKLKSDLTEEDYKLLPPPPPPPSQDQTSLERLATYNGWCKKYNAMIKSGDNVVIKKAEVDYMKAIYASMSTKQKKEAEPFPNFPPPPPKPKEKKK